MLADVLRPVPAATFATQYFTRRFLHIPGPPDKFTKFFNWDLLNSVLEQHRFPTPPLASPRLRLVKGGNSVKTGAYLDDDRVNARGLARELAGGATLIFNHCDEVHPPLREFCVELERRFHASAHANLYAGWRHDNGFDVHWDDQDTLILHIAGRKHWKIWSPTRIYPFKRDVVDTSSKTTAPSGQPLWDEVLEQGGLLSIPRGWWHVAYPMDEPCMHLTFTIVNPNGIDLLHWLADAMKTSEAARMDLPLLASEDDRRTWLESVRHDLAAAWTDDLLDRYVWYLDEQAKARPSLRLPQLDPSPAPVVNATTTLQLARPRALRFQASDGIARFYAAGVNWETTIDLVPALERFNDGLPHSAAEVAPAGGATLMTMLTALVMKGVLQPVMS